MQINIELARYRRVMRTYQLPLADLKGRCLNRYGVAGRGLLKRYGGEPDPLARPGVRELAAFYA